jgi:hypothetical protein
MEAPPPATMIRHLVALFLLGGSLPAQTDLHLEEIRALPALGVSSDHAVVALNRSGDLLVAWQSLARAGSTTRQVEAVLLPRTGPGSWAFPAAGEVLLLGDPAPSRMGNDTCQKPVAVALDEDFLVGWIRADQASQTARVELVRVLPGGVVDAPQPGVGWTATPDYACGSSGRTLALCRRTFDPDRPGRRLDASVHFVTVTETRRDGVQRDYRLEAWTADFKKSAGHAPDTAGPWPLAEGVAVDLAVPGGHGRIPPSVLEDDAGDLLLAFEEYRAQARHPAAGGHQGGIHLRRFLTTRNGPVADGALLLRGDHPDWLQRRPHLDASPHDDNDLVTLCWTEFDPDGGRGRGHQYEVRFPGAGPEVVEVPLPVAGDPAATSVRSLHGSGLYVSLSTHDRPSEQLLGLQASPPAGLRSWSFPGRRVQRPHADLRDEGLAPGQRDLAMAFDVDSGAGGRILLVVYRV